MIAAKALQLKRVENNDEEAIMELIQSKMVSSGISLPGDIEVKYY